MTPNELLKLFVALIVMINPVGSAPVFLALTERVADRRRAIARRAVVAMTVVLVVAAFVGRPILDLFGISVDHFRVVGGILFLLMSLDMLNASPSRTRQTPEETSEAAARDDVAVVPLGVPILAGPGAISWVLINMAEAGDFAGKALVIGVVAVAAVLTYLVLLSAGSLGRRLGTSGRNVLTRLMGLIIGAIAVEYLVDGLQSLIPALAVPPA